MHGRTVVVVSWPPAAIPFAMKPSKTIGLSWARAAEIAAVWAAGPLPMMHSFVRTIWTTPDMQSVRVEE